MTSRARFGRWAAIVLLVLAIVTPLRLDDSGRVVAEVLGPDTTVEASQSTDAGQAICDSVSEATPEPEATTLEQPDTETTETSETDGSGGEALPGEPVDCSEAGGDEGSVPGDDAGTGETIVPAATSDEGDATAPPEESVDQPTAEPTEVSQDDEPVTIAEETPSTEDTTQATGEGTPTAEEGAPTADEATPIAGEGAQAGEEIALVHIPVVVFVCTADPGPGDPATSGFCAGADGVEIAYSIDGVPAAPVTTTGGGSAVLEVPEGAAVFVHEAVPAGYLPVGDGTAWIASAADGNAVTFVNIIEALLGRLQLVNGSCPTSGDARTEFRVLGPHAISAAATPVCSPTAQAVFTITGDTLPPSGIQAVTDDNGVWRGYLTAGDYTVTDDSGASETVTVEADELTVVIVIDYFEPPTGTLVIQKWWCTEGEAEGTEILIDGDASGPGCALTDAQIALSEVGNPGSSSSISFGLGPDGEATMALPEGTYLLTDVSSSASAQVEVRAGRTTRASVRTIALYGTLVVRHFWCADPESNSEDASDPSYWEAECDPAGGVSVTLFDAGGSPLDTKQATGGGVVTWSGLTPGTYTVDTENGICAAFVDGVDARAGVEIVAGSTTMASLYSCASPNSTGGGGNDGDGTGGTGDNGGNTGGDNGNGGGDGTQGPPEANDGGTGGSDTGTDGDEVAGVTTLPSTGSGPSHPQELPLIAVVIGVALGGALAITGRRYGRLGLQRPR